MTKKVLLTALLAAAALPAAAADATQKERPYALDLTAATYAGGFDGYGVRDESGSMAIVEVSSRPELRADRLRLEVPFRVAHRQTFGADLSETTGAIDLEPWYEVTKRVRFGLEGGVLGASRPGWKDLYKPGLAPTDRFGYLAWRAGVQAYARPAAHQHLRARYRFASYDYVNDPQFDPNDLPAGGPMHLTPRDNDQHQLDLSWRYVEKSWSLALRVDYTRRNEKELLSRSRRTGSTQGFTTPLQETALWEPSVELQLTPLGDRVELSLRYGIDSQDDLYQGYYSYTQHHPRVSARWAVTDRLTAEASYEGWLREYGADGTQPATAGGTVRLDYGTVRTSSRVALGGELGYALASGLRARASVEWVDRGTNYADYTAPGPVIDWDYTNLTALAGLEYRR